MVLYLRSYGRNPWDVNVAKRSSRESWEISLRTTLGRKVLLVTAMQLMNKKEDLMNVPVDKMFFVVSMLLVCFRALATTYPYYYYTVEQKRNYNYAYPGQLISWNITEHKVRGPGDTVVWSYSGICESTVYRDGVAIASTDNRYFYDYGIRANTTHEYYIVAMGKTSNVENFVCEWNYWADLSNEAIAFEDNGGLQNITVSGVRETRTKGSDDYYVTTSSVDWNAVSKASWMTVVKSGDTLTISADANNSGIMRSGVVKITIEGYDVRDIQVTQEASRDYIAVEVGAGIVSIPKTWFEEKCPLILENAGGDYGATALLEAANGRTVWECYVAGLNPMDATSRFEAMIEMRNGLPCIEWSPNLNTNGIVRTYTIYGMTNLTDNAWHSPTNESSRFFKVEVGMP